MIFRYCGNILVSMQSYFLKVKGVKEFMFRCHTLTHGTDLRRLPPIWENQLKYQVTGSQTAMLQESYLLVGYR